jgi:hypothetical protein
MLVTGEVSNVTFCELRDTCYFYIYGLSGMPTTSEYIRYKYCLGDYSKCQWYLNSKGLWNELMDEI